MCYSKEPSFILELARSMVISFSSFQGRAPEGRGLWLCRWCGDGSQWVTELFLEMGALGFTKASDGIPGCQSGSKWEGEDGKRFLWTRQGHLELSVPLNWKRKTGRRSDKQIHSYRLRNEVVSVYVGRWVEDASRTDLLSTVYRIPDLKHLNCIGRNLLVAFPTLKCGHFLTTVLTINSVS